MRFCPQCGAPLLAGAKFCVECGRALDVAASGAGESGERATRPQYDHQRLCVRVRRARGRRPGRCCVDLCEDARSRARANRQRASGRRTKCRRSRFESRSRAQCAVAGSECQPRIRRRVEVRTAVCRRDIPRSSCRPRLAVLSTRSSETPSRNRRTSRRGTNSARSRCARRCSINPTTARPRKRTATC